MTIITINIESERFEEFLKAIKDLLKEYIDIKYEGKKIEGIPEDIGKFSPSEYIEKRILKAEEPILKIKGNSFDKKFLEELYNEIGILKGGYFRPLKSTPSLNFWNVGYSLGVTHVEEWTGFKLELSPGEPPANIKKDFDRYKKKKRFSDIPYEILGVQGYIKGCEDAIEECKEYKKRGYEIDEEIGKKERRFEELEEDIKNREKDKQTLENDITNLKSEKQRLVDELRDIRLKHAKVCKYLEKEDEIEQKLIDYTNALKQQEMLKTSIGNLENERTELQETVTNLRNEQGKINTWINENKELKDKLIEEIKKFDREYFSKMKMMETIELINQEDIKALSKLFGVDDITQGYELVIENPKEVLYKILSSYEEDGKIIIPAIGLNKVLPDFIRYLRDKLSIAKRVSVLELSKDVREKYNEVHSKLLGRYDLEKRKGTVMTSIFWLTCMEEIYNSIIMEKIRRRIRNIQDLDYDKMMKCINSIGETVFMKMKSSGYEYDLKNIHGPEDINHIREMIKNELDDLLELYRNESKEWIDRKLENVKISLNKWKGIHDITTNDIKLIFLNPVIAVIEEMDNCEAEEDKVGMSLIGITLNKYLAEYKAYY